MCLENLKENIEEYIPYNEQEEMDKSFMLDFIEKNNDCLLRDNRVAHFTASSWIINKDKTKVIMIYHNIYNSWAWTGGHADGNEDLLEVAINEAMEETGIHEVKPIFKEIFSLEIITVDGHIKRGSYVPSHLHMNVTFLLEADDKELLIVKPDENSGVSWIPVDKVSEACSEPWMMKWIYEKLINKSKGY